MHHYYDFYHPDHLGSSSFITDATGYAVQHLQYLPFGETWIDQQSGSFDSLYKFSAKELDDETQYSYFGARYYDSVPITIGMSVWLSVDPLSDKFPSTSSFMFVLGNPIKLVDYNGMDTIIVNRMGRFSKPIPAEGDHVFVRGTNKERRTQEIKYDENGKLRDRHRTVSVDRNSVKIEENKRWGLFAGKNTEVTLTGQIGIDKGQELFEFFADNTIVEWAFDSYVDRENKYNAEALIYTSHSRESVSESCKFELVLYKPERYVLISHFHSHPDNWLGVRYPNASPGDDENKSEIQKTYPSTMFQIYLPKNSNSAGYYKGY